MPVVRRDGHDVLAGLRERRGDDAADGAAAHDEEARAERTSEDGEDDGGVLADIGARQ